MQKIISNVFTLGMLDLKVKHTVLVRPVTVGEAVDFLKSAESSVGHEQTAKLMSNELGVNVPFNRRTDRLDTGDQVLVGQYTGPRLPEGTIALPEGESLSWVLVTVQ